MGEILCGEILALALVFVLALVLVLGLELALVPVLPRQAVAVVGGGTGPR